LIGSVSVISEAIHSGVDLIAAVIALFSVRTSSRPADESHPFGHGKIENISGTIEALLIFLAAGWIIFEAIKKFIHPEPLESPLWGVGVMLFSAVTNMVVSRMLFKVGKETDSIALQADAWHLRTDVYTSAGVMAGLTILWLGEWIFPGHHFHWMDPASAIGVAILIVKAAYDLTVQSARDLLDVNLPPEEKAWICEFIAAQKDTVHGYHYLRTRKAGHFRFIEFHIQVDAQMTVETSHHLAQRLSKAIKERFPYSTVTVHVEPCMGECSDKCLSGCLLAEVERRRISRKPALAELRGRVTNTR
ncbi:MAG: cation diffusion facilitator family transporter, partial [Deltaproteobacteria bacterium]|nr:cation diffusion facilitator family transporter [Deltaproteobacteria bacterium]